MTINIQNASNVTVVGTRTSKNCKAVYNITTGEIYASVCDAADALGTTQGAVSIALAGNHRSCRGMRLCFVSKMMEHLQEITECNHTRLSKVKAYDEMLAKQENLRKAKEKVAKHKEAAEELRRKLAEAEALVKDAESELHALQN